MSLEERSPVFDFMAIDEHFDNSEVTELRRANSDVAELRKLRINLARNLGGCGLTFSEEYVHLDGVRALLSLLLERSWFRRA